MATTMEQRAKFRELRTSGISRDEAQKQAYGNITPVVPSTLVAPATDINSDANRLARLQASGGSPTAIANLQNTAPVAPSPTTPVAPAPMVQAPVDQTTGLSKPLESTKAPFATAPIAEVKPSTTPTTPAKIEVPIDYTQAKGRESEITANLDSFKAKGMTPDEIMRASDYQNASPEKRALIDPYLKVQTPTTSAMYNAIASKADIPDEQKTTLPYKIAQNRYAKANMYSTMTASQLSSEMNSSKLIQGSQAYEDLKAMNPKLVQDTENLRTVNGTKQNVFTYVNNPDGTKTKVNHLENSFANDFQDNFGDIIKQMYQVQTPEQIRAIIRTPDVVQAEEKASAIELTMNELEKQIANIDTDVEKELSGSGATGSRIALEKASRHDKLEKEYNSQLKNYTSYANKANNLITQNTTLYTTQQQQKQQQNAAMLPMIQDQYKTAQEKYKAEQALNDPATAIQTAIDEYKKLGIPFTSTVQSRLAEFKKSGLSLPDYLTQMRTNIQQSPAYQKYQSLQNGQLSDAQKVASSQAFEMKKLGIEQDFQMKLAKAKQTTDNKWTKLDDGLYTNDSGEIITADELKAAKLTNNGYISKPVGAEGGECGFYASRGTGMTSTPGGNSKEARVQAFSDKTPEVGGMAFFGGAGYDKTYGHISIVTGVNADGSINVKDSNYTGDKTVKERTVPASSVTGYYNNTPLASSIKGGTTEKQGTQYTDSDIELLAELANMDASARNTALKAQGIPLKAVTDYMAEAKSGRIPATESQKQSATQIISSIQDLASMDWNDATGVNFSMMDEAPSGSDWATAQSKINNLVASITLPNLGMLKGPMSDKDLAFIQNASSKLAMTQSDSEFQKQLIELYNISARKAGLAEITDLSKIPSGRIIPGQQPVQPQGNTNTGVGQISPEAQSIKNEWLNR